ncbi:MAG: methylmalonyl Co-A mutase-associated GTPase MeaB [Myxococcota bacterium]
MPPRKSSDTAPERLAEGIAAGDPADISKALNRIDDNRPENRESVLALLDEMEGRRRAHRIGVTGAPGSGKSTLLDALVAGLRGRGRSVGILAVDPSSQRTGGALLGDRMRLSSAARDTGVFLRSLAARDQLGGLSEVTGPSLDIMQAGFDIVFVETVGVGQSEAGIIDLVDSLVFVAQPAAGDLIQFMKAGILEWPDIFFVNKSDLGEAAKRTASELQAGLELANRRDPETKPRVLCGSARDAVGIEDLIDAIEAHQRVLKSSGLGDSRHAAGRIARVKSILLARYGRFGLERLTGPLDIASYVTARATASVERLADDLGRGVESALRDGAD